MAFNFNWSPLTADAEFYLRAQEMLTTALNKNPKPPIIVDDILVSELNLGSVPPDLEILEIGDLAEDRFRGIFKMCYSGDAFLTLKTRVQVRCFCFLIFPRFSRDITFMRFSRFYFAMTLDVDPEDARSFHCFMQPRDASYNVRLIYQQTGKPDEYVPILKTIVYLAATASSIIWINDSLENYLIGYQAFGLHHPRLLAPKGLDVGVPQ